MKNRTRGSRIIADPTPATPQVGILNRFHLSLLLFLTPSFLTPRGDPRIPDFSERVQDSQRSTNRTRVDSYTV